MDFISSKVLDCVDQGILLIDHDFRVKYINKKAREIFKSADLEKETCYSLIFNKQNPCANCFKSRLSEKNTPIVFKLCLFNNSYIVEYNYLDDKYFLILLKKLEEQEYYKKRFSELLNKLPVLIIFLKKGKIKYVNKFAEELTGYKKEELLESYFVDFLVSLEDKIRLERWIKDDVGGCESCNFSILTKNKEKKTILGRIFSIEDINNDKVLVVSGLDVSDILELKKKVEELYKNQTFSNFLKSIIHDFNNILQITNEYINNIKKNLQHPEKIKDYISLAENTLNSWIDLNRLLLDYTKEIKEIVTSRVDIVSFLKNNLELFQIIAGPKINIQLDFGYLMCVKVPGDESFWRYIFLNFINNAKDAIEEEGKIEIKLRSSMGFDKNKYLSIFIKDTGCGIPEEDLDKIFQPNFTTKENGSGLGLFLIKNHIETIGGRIEVESTLGKGTVFKLYVPILSIKTLTSGKIHKPEEVVIVLIEDEEPIRNSLKDLLKLKGYNVYAFSSFKEFKKEMENFKKIDLLISDFHLPDIDGPAFYKFLKEKFPEIEVIFLTGDILTLAELPSYRMLLKPFKIEDLLAKIREVLS